MRSETPPSPPHIRYLCFYVPSCIFPLPQDTPFRDIRIKVLIYYYYFISRLSLECLSYLPFL